MTALVLLLLVVSEAAVGVFLSHSFHQELGEYPVTYFQLAVDHRILSQPVCALARPLTSLRFVAMDTGAWDTLPCVRPDLLPSEALLWVTTSRKPSLIVLASPVPAAALACLQPCNRTLGP